MANQIYVIGLLAAMITLCSGSAIPMWEFLSRTEKMSHLYSVFAKDVSKYCKINFDTSVTQCKRDLLAYGVDKLEKMSDVALDILDPYQGSANDIIWDTIMEGHPLMLAKKQSTTVNPIREPTGEYEKNPLFDNDNDRTAENHKTVSDYANEMDASYDGSYDLPTGPSEGAYIEPSNSLPQESATNLDIQFDNLPLIVAPSTNYLTGPLVIRVRPDGSPVEEDRLRPLPRDDDREAFSFHHKHFTSIPQISDRLQPPTPEKDSSISAYSNYRTIARIHQ